MRFVDFLFLLSLLAASFLTLGARDGLDFRGDFSAFAGLLFAFLRAPFLGVFLVTFFLGFFFAIIVLANREIASVKFDLV